MIYCNKSSCFSKSTLKKKKNPVKIKFFFSISKSLLCSPRWKSPTPHKKKVLIINILLHTIAQPFPPTRYLNENFIHNNN